LIGQAAPVLVLKNQAGEDYNLADHVGKKPLVLFFYPKDETTGCTKEACSFRDSYSIFQQAGAEVIGISGDGVDSHKSFADKQRLPYPLLADTEGKARAAYQVPKSLLGMLPGRVSFVIDRQGKVVDAFDSHLDFSGHSKNAIELIKKM